MTYPFQEEGFSPMHVSAWEGDEQVVKYLNQVKANPNIVDKVRSLLNLRENYPPFAWKPCIEIFGITQLIFSKVLK